MNLTKDDVCHCQNPYTGVPVEDKQGYKRHSICGKIYRNYVFECAACEELSVWNNHMFPWPEAYCYCIHCQLAYNLPPIE